VFAVLSVSLSEPATIDTENMHFTHDGERGFNHGLSSADYGQLNALMFWIKFRAALPLFQLPEGDFKFRAYLNDTSDNVLFQDFIVPHNGVWEAINLPLSSFQTYRGRKPIEHVLSSLIPPKALSPANVFEQRNLKSIVIQCQEAYDKDGRYHPADSGNRLNTYALAGNLGQALTMTMHIDALRFGKPLLAVTDKVTERYISTDEEEPTITNYNQLFNDARAKLEKIRFIRKQFDVATSGRYDIRAGHSLFLENADLISDADDGVNTIKLVGKRIEYSITKPKGGSGGFQRVIQGVRRLET